MINNMITYNIINSNNLDNFIVGNSMQFFSTLKSNRKNFHYFTHKSSFLIDFS